MGYFLEHTFFLACIQRSTYAISINTNIILFFIFFSMKHFSNIPTYLIQNIDFQKITNINHYTNSPKKGVYK